MEIPQKKAVLSVSEYLSSMKPIKTVVSWMFTEITTPYTRKRMVHMFCAIVLVMAQRSLTPLIVGYLLKGAVEKNVNTILTSLVAFVALMVCEKLTAIWYDSAREWVVGIHLVKLQKRITEILFAKSVGQHVHESVMLGAAHIEKGFWKLHELQSTLTFEIIPVFFQLLLSFVFLCFLSMKAGLVMATVLLIYVSWSLYLNFRVNKECTSIEKEFKRLNHYKVERWMNVERVKVNGQEVAEVTHLDTSFTSNIDKDRKFWLWFIRVGYARGIVADTGLLCIILWGTYLVFMGKMSIGLLYPLYVWTAQVTDNMWKIGDLERNVNRNLPSVVSMLQALNIAPDVVDTPSAQVLDHTVPHRVEFKDVSHTYPKEEKQTEDQPAALKAISFAIEKGEKVALLGPSGSGKSTAMKKLLRFANPTSGSILVDGVDLKDITQSSWLRGIGYIPQQAQVLDGTVRDNLLYGLTAEERKQVSDEEIWRIMRLLKIDFKERLVNGLDTIVGKSGIKLSGGQAQRLMIGAAIMRKPWLLVVDEATSSLDSTTEKEVQEGLQTILKQSPTSALIVAHRLSTVRSMCNTFVVLKPAASVSEGESQVEAIAGSFEELYAISPTFRQLADDQGIVMK